MNVHYNPFDPLVGQNYPKKLCPIGSAQLVLLIVHSTFLESMRLGELDECKKVYLVSGFFCYGLLEVLHGLSFTNVKK